LPVAIEANLIVYCSVGKSFRRQIVKFSTRINLPEFL